MALDQQNGETEPAGDGEMSFLEHLEALRWHLVRAVGAIIIFTIVGLIYVKEVFDHVILAPAKSDFWTWRMLCKLGHAVGKEDLLCIKDIPLELQSRFMTGQFTITIVSGLVVGLVVAFPYVVWELWRFVKPGLHIHERQNSTGAVAAVSTLFASGVSFGYFIIAPLMVYVLVNYRISDMIVNEFDITSYVSTFLALVLGSGLLFQLPVVIYFLSKVGIVTPKFLRQYRKHSIVVILIIAAIITPPDPLSQLLISLPLYLLFEISILISAAVHRNKQKEAARQEKSDS